MSSIKLALLGSLLGISFNSVAQSQLPRCPESGEKHNCIGAWNSPFGLSYIGEFKNNKFDGQGVQNYPNGERYEGEFKKGVWDGKGSQYKADGTLLRTGTWRNDKFIDAVQSAPQTASTNAIQPQVNSKPIANRLDYAGKIRNAIVPNIKWTGPSDANPAVEVEIRTDPDGKIISNKVTKPSVDPAWDRAVQDALSATGFIPKDVDGKVPRALIIVSRPRDFAQYSSQPLPNSDVSKISTQNPNPVLAASAPPPSVLPVRTGLTRSDIRVACPTQVLPEMPRTALQDGTEGTVKAQVTIKDGAVTDVTILSGPRVFHAAVRAAMMQYKCVSGSGEVLATQQFEFKTEGVSITLEPNQVCPVQVPPELPPQTANLEQRTVIARGTIKDGKVVDVNILSGEGPFHPAVRNAMLQYKCISTPVETSITQQFRFDYTTAIRHSLWLASTKSTLDRCPATGPRNDCVGSETKLFGTSYVGEFRRGQRNGLGALTSRQGDVYIGEFSNGNPTGHGVHTWPEDGLIDSSGILRGVGKIGCSVRPLPEMSQDAEEGDVVAAAQVKDGTVIAVVIFSGDIRHHINVRNALLKYRCDSTPTPAWVVQEFKFHW